MSQNVILNEEKEKKIPYDKKAANRNITLGIIGYTSPMNAMMIKIMINNQYTHSISYPSFIF